MQHPRRCRCPVARWITMAALGAAICNALTGRWKRIVGIQALWGLTTVARQPGEIAVGALKPSHIVCKLLLHTANCFGRQSATLSSKVRVGFSEHSKTDKLNMI